MHELIFQNSVSGDYRRFALFCASLSLSILSKSRSRIVAFEYCSIMRMHIVATFGRGNFRNGEACCIRHVGLPQLKKNRALRKSIIALERIAASNLK